MTIPRIFQRRGQKDQKKNKKDNYDYPTINTCKYILRLCDKNLQLAYFNQLLEIVFAGEETIFFHEIVEGDNFKKRILETVLMMEWEKLITKGFEKILDEVFCLSQEEIEVGKIYLQKWLNAEESELPSYSALPQGCKYWVSFENEHSGWRYLSMVSKLFSNTSLSESSVERDFSKGRLRTGDRRFNLDWESMDAELLI
jgi:hypothetical protein